MKAITSIFTYILFLGLTGCAITPPVNWNIPSETEIRVRIENDDFKKHTIYRGPDIAGWRDSLFIRAWRNYGSNHVTYQIYIQDHYSGDWRFYNRAFDSNGNNLDLIEISRDVGSCGQYGCSFDEHVGVKIDRKYLDDSVKTGIRIKLYGKAGQEIFFIPGGYIQGFLKKVDSFKK